MLMCTFCHLTRPATTAVKRRLNKRRVLIDFCKGRKDREHRVYFKIALNVSLPSPPFFFICFTQFSLPSSICLVNIKRILLFTCVT